MTSASDPKEVAKARRKASDALTQQQDDLKQLLAVPAFRRYMWRLIGERCRFMESPGSSNGSIQSVNIGRQDVARELWAEIEQTDPMAIPQMMTEFFEAQRAAV